MRTSGPTARQGRKRVVVLGQFTLVVEAISRALLPVARPMPVALDTCPARPAAREAARGKSALVVLVVTPEDSLDALDLVSDLAVRGEQVLVVGTVCGEAASRELIAAGATEVLDGHGLSDLTRVAVRLTSGAAVRRPALAAAAPRVPAVPADGRAVRRNLARLTSAEARTLWRLMHGSSAAEIARAHVVSVETVRSHIRGLLGKLGTSNQLAAVALAWEADWHPAPDVLSAA